MTNNNQLKTTIGCNESDMDEVSQNILLCLASLTPAKQGSMAGALCSEIPGYPASLQNPERCGWRDTWAVQDVQFLAAKLQ